MTPAYWRIWTPPGLQALFQCWQEGRLHTYIRSLSWAHLPGRVRYDGRTFDEAELNLAAEYLRTKSEIDPSWPEVSPAARAAWNRVDGRWTSIV